MKGVSVLVLERDPLKSLEDLENNKNYVEIKDKTTGAIIKICITKLHRGHIKLGFVASDNYNIARSELLGE